MTDAQRVPVLGIEADFDLDHAAGIEERVAGRGGVERFRLCCEIVRGDCAPHQTAGNNTPHREAEATECRKRCAFEMLATPTAKARGPPGGGTWVSIHRVNSRSSSSVARRTQRKPQ